jgi:hypothetical protein
LTWISCREALGMCGQVMFEVEIFPRLASHFETILSACRRSVFSQYYQLQSIEALHAR